MNRRELVAQDLARKSGVALIDYPFGSKPGYVGTDLDVLRTVEDPWLRERAWDLYWLLKAEKVEHSYRLDGDQAELERRFP